MPSELDLARIQRLVDELDQIVPKDGAFVSFEQYGGGKEEAQTTGNQNGYLRLGIELAKGASSIDRTFPGPAQIPVQIDYLVTSNSDYVFDWFGLTADQKSEFEAKHGQPTDSPQPSRLAQIGCITVIAVFAITVMVGLGTIAKIAFSY